MTRQARFILISVPLACIAMAFVETVLCPGYWVKALIRILLFGGAIAAYALRFRSRELRSLFHGASLRSALLLAMGAFCVLLGGFALLRPFIDLTAIAAGLGAGQNITADNFPLVALYICVVNSLLEELFFRGFSFLILRRHLNPTAACLFSAAAFSLYHVSILSGWFSLWLFCLLLGGLFLCGLLFNWLDRRGSLWPSWLLHASANAAINTIGLWMFGLL